MPSGTVSHSIKIIIYSKILYMVSGTVRVVGARSRQRAMTVRVRGGRGTARFGRRRRRFGVGRPQMLGTKISFPFPQILKTKMRTIISDAINASGAAVEGNAQELFFKLNSVIFMGPSGNYPLGTSDNFLSNVPAGLRYLLANERLTNIGSVAPYNRFYVSKSTIMFEFIPHGVSNRATQITIIPRAEGALRADTLENRTLAEQPFAKSWTITPSLTTRQTKCIHTVSTKELAGVRDLSNDDHEYTGDAGHDPANLQVWQVRLSNLDNSSTARLGSYKVTIIQDVMFYMLNYVSSDVPTGGPSGVSGPDGQARVGASGLKHQNELF